MTPSLELQAVSKSFGDFTAVNEVSFAVPQGTIYGLLGPNGAGKTTTLQIACSSRVGVIGESWRRLDEDVGTILLGREPLETTRSSTRR